MDGRPENGKDRQRQRFGKEGFSDIAERVASDVSSKPDKQEHAGGFQAPPGSAPETGEAG